MKNLWKVCLIFGVMLLFAAFALDARGQQRSIDKCWPTKYPPVPKCAIEGPLTGRPPLHVIFDGSGSFDPDGGEIKEYVWTLWNGQKIYEKTFPWDFWQSGTYIVQLQVKDDENAWSKETEGYCQPVVVTIIPPLCKSEEIYNFKAKYITVDDPVTKKVLPGFEASWRTKQPTDGYFYVKFRQKYLPSLFWQWILDWADYSEYKTIFGPILANRKDNKYSVQKYPEPRNGIDEVALIYICGDACKVENHHLIGVAPVEIPKK